MATPQLLFGLHAARWTVALAPHFYSLEGDDSEEHIHFSLLGLGTSIAAQLAETTDGRLQLHLFGSFVYGVATITSSYDGEEYRAHSDAMGGSFGALARGFLFPMLALDVGASLDILDFEEGDSDDGATQLQLLGFLGLTFAG